MPMDPTARKHRLPPWNPTRWQPRDHGGDHGQSWSSRRPNAPFPGSASPTRHVNRRQAWSDVYRMLDELVLPAARLRLVGGALDHRRWWFSLLGSRLVDDGVVVPISPAKNRRCTELPHVQLRCPGHSVQAAPHSERRSGNAHIGFLLGAFSHATRGVHTFPGEPRRIRLGDYAARGSYTRGHHPAGLALSGWGGCNNPRRIRAVEDKQGSVYASEGSAAAPGPHGSVPVPPRVVPHAGAQVGQNPSQWPSHDLPPPFFICFPFLFLFLNFKFEFEFPGESHI
jgi:hypothetical protein